MIPAGQPLAPGHCAHCRVECRDCLGIEIYPHRPDLAEAIIWQCPLCGARVGSHPDGTALGTAADEELRKARGLLHGRLDPIWKDAHRHPSYQEPRDGDGDRRRRAAIIAKTARARTYRFLAARLGLTKDQCHVAMFDLEQCRAAWTALFRVSYDEVRTWAKDNPVPDQEAGKKKAREKRAGQSRGVSTGDGQDARPSC